MKTPDDYQALQVAPGASESPQSMTPERWRWLVAGPARLAVALGLAVLGGLLLASTLLGSNEQPSFVAPRAERSVPADRIAAVLVDDSGGLSGLMAASVVGWRTDDGLSRIKVRIDNQTTGSVALGQSDFTMPEATPPVSVASPSWPSTLAPGEAVEVWLAFTGHSPVLLWCPQARPGTCIRL